METQRTWRVSATFEFPAHYEGVDVVDGVPQRIERVSRVPNAHANVLGVPLRVEPTQIEGWAPAGDLVQISFLTNSEDASEASRVAGPIIETLVETFSFQLQRFVPVVTARIVDVTQPAVEGDVREALSFPRPHGYPLPKYSAGSEALGGVRTTLRPSAGLNLDGDRKARAALTWYVKSLSAPYDADRFMFLWIALEILWARSGTVVEAPYKPACGHLISSCPICEAPTMKRVLGLSVQRFLVDASGVTPDDARALWQMRRIFHGAVDFESEKMEPLPRLLQLLRAAVAALLKDTLGIASGDPPFIDPTPSLIWPQIALGMTVALTAKDLCLDE